MNDITALKQAEINDALAQLKQLSEYPTPSTQYARVLRKYISSLVEALEKAQTENTDGVAGMAESYETTISMLKSRIAELEREKVAYESVAQALRDDMRESRTVTVDADVSDRNQPGMVVAVHIDAGDFVKIKDQVFEVLETDFDDHDVTLWFVGGEVLKCAAGCLVEVVSDPTDDGIQVIEGGE